MLYKLLYIFAWTALTTVAMSSFLKHGEEYLWKELKRLSSEYAKEHNSDCIQEDIHLLRKLFEEVYYTTVGVFRGATLIFGFLLYVTVVAIIYIA
jgi:hypothetical protein